MINAAAILQAIAAQPGIDPAFARVIAADPELVEVEPAPCFDDPPDYSDEEPLRDPKYADAASANWFAYRTKGVCE